MKKSICIITMVLAFCVFGFGNILERDSKSTLMVACGSTYGTVKDPAQNGIGGVTINLHKYNVLLGGYILDQTDTTDAGTGFLVRYC